MIAWLQAMFVSFGMAAESNGDCYLRFDDTNPEAEKLEYIEHIQDIVSWMGWKPYKVGQDSRACQAMLITPNELACRLHATVEAASCSMSEASAAVTADCVKPSE